MSLSDGLDELRRRLVDGVFPLPTDSVRGGGTISSSVINTGSDSMWVNADMATTFNPGSIYDEVINVNTENYKHAFLEIEDKMNISNEYKLDIGQKINLFVSLECPYFPTVYINKYLEFIEFDFLSNITPINIPVMIGDYYIQLYKTNTGGYNIQGNGWNSDQTFHLRNDFTPSRISGIKSDVLISVIKEVIFEFTEIYPAIRERNTVFTDMERRFLISDYVANHLPGKIQSFVRTFSRSANMTQEELEQLFFKYPHFNSFSSFTEPKEIVEQLKLAV